ncbi:MAG: stealth family protein [Rikenellaceae bacterium]
MERKIDLVYLWCDGNDIEWRKRRNKYLHGVDTSDEQSFCEGRVVDNNDLLYSLRSAEICAPWINHIYIITDNQCPKWLDLTNDRLTVVDLREICDEEILPLYNSTSIELNIHKIKGLSEYYIYANDDMMFGRAISPDFFFTNDGKVKCRVVKRRINTKSQQTYKITINRVIKTIVSDFGEEYNDLQPHHQIDAYLKSSVAECVEKYAEWSQKTLNNRFRSPEDMQRHILVLYALATKRGVMICRTGFWIPKVIKPLMALLGLSDGVDSHYYSVRRKNIVSKVKRYRPALICFNDGDRVKEHHRTRLKKVYEELFPLKSSFERG